jgi:hypothetical protein
MPGGVSLHMRLAGVRLERPSLRRAVVEKALWRHLSAIGAETDDVTWVADVEAGFAHVRERLQAGHRVWSPSSSGSWLRFSVWDPDAPVSYPDRDLPRRDDPVGAPIVRVARASLGRRWRVHRTSRTYRRWRESYASVPDPVSVYRLALAAADEQAIVLSGRPALDAFAEPDADDFWAEVRADSRWREAVRTYESARMRAPVLEPLVTAFRAGLAFFWLVESANWRQRRCIAVPRPAIHLQNGRLDRADGPAVEWPNGTSYWFWEGLHIPRRAAERAGPAAGARPHRQPREAPTPARPDRLRALPRHRRRHAPPARRLRQALAHHAAGRRRAAHRRRGRQRHTRTRRHTAPLLPPRTTTDTHRPRSGRLDLRLQRCN